MDHARVVDHVSGGGDGNAGADANAGEAIVDLDPLNQGHRSVQFLFEYQLLGRWPC